MRSTQSCDRITIYIKLPVVVVSVVLVDEAALEVKATGTAMAVATQPAMIRPSAINKGVLNRLMKLFRRKII